MISSAMRSTSQEAMMLYPIIQALFYVFVAGIILLIALYIFRAEIAHLIGRTLKQVNNGKREVIQEYHKGMEEEGKE